MGQRLNACRSHMTGAVIGFNEPWSWDETVHLSFRFCTVKSLTMPLLTWLHVWSHVWKFRNVCKCLIRCCIVTKIVEALGSLIIYTINKCWSEKRNCTFPVQKNVILTAPVDISSVKTSKLSILLCTQAACFRVSFNCDQSKAHLRANHAL